MVETAVKSLVGLFVTFSVAAFSLVLAFPVMWCWNCAMPYIFHLPIINWIVSFSLCILATTFFKSSLITLDKK